MFKTNSCKATKRPSVETVLFLAGLRAMSDQTPRGRSCFRLTSRMIIRCLDAKDLYLLPQNHLDALAPRHHACLSWHVDPRKYVKAEALSGTPRKSSPSTPYFKIKILNLNHPFFLTFPFSLPIRCIHAQRLPNSHFSPFKIDQYRAITLFIVEHVTRFYIFV